MLTVSHDVVPVELDLVAGRLGCPGCGGRLHPWGWARRRTIRDGHGPGWVDVEHRPRRGRCSGCRATHVLLDVVLAARRADSAGVIAAGIEAKIAAGWGHRKIAAELGRPASTVRGWLRAFAASAAQIAGQFTGLVHRDAVDAASLWPKPAGSSPAAALSALLAYAQALGGRFGAVVMVAWVQAGIAASNGRLFCSSFWSAGANTNTPLWRPRPVGQGGVSACHIPVTGVFTAC